MDCEFKRVAVSHVTKGGSLIGWEMAQHFVPVGPLHFYVDFGWPGTDEWTVLNAEPIIDDCFYVDSCQRNWKILNEAYYRVRLVMPGVDGCPVIKSQPTLAIGRLEKKDWLRARDIVRREHLQQRKVDGTPGFLLKRKKFGVACTACRDFDTDEVTNGDCAICYGTGIVGGYYPGIVFYLSETADWKRRINVATPPRGTNADLVDDGNRCVLFPLVDTRDVWVDGDSDARYIIDSFTLLAAYKGLPLVASLKMSLAPGSHIVYSVPIEQELPSSSESSSESCGATKGLAAEDSDGDW
jgi:hypothetical protein